MHMTCARKSVSNNHALLITNSLSVIHLPLVLREQSTEMQPLAHKCNHLPPIKHIFKQEKRI